jgi:Zn-dependent protease with chaperone function
LLLVSLHDAWPNPLGLEPVGACLITGGGVLALAVVGEALIHFTCWTLRREPANRAAIIRRYTQFKRWHLLAQCGWFLAALYFFGWGRAVFQAGETWAVPGFKVVMLAPLLAGLVIGWARHYDVERLNNDILWYPETAPFQGRWAYFGLQARHHLLFLVPAMLLLVAQDSLFLAVPSLKSADNALVMALSAMGLLAVALVVIPFFLRLFLGLRPLPDGPLRERLLRTAQRLNFRFNDVLVWNTRKGIANAMVTGVAPWLRYVVVTDQLLHELTEDEIEAVFGHEVGHMKHHHIFFYMVFILASLFLLSGLWSASEAWFRRLDAPTWVANLVEPATWHAVSVCMILLVVAVYMFVVFGWLSRRCERQADIYGCKTATPAAFISALEKVADLNGISREHPGFLSWWQHSTIADRVSFIRRMETDPALEPRFQRRLGWTKWGVAMGLIALVVLMRLNWEWDLTRLM